MLRYALYARKSDDDTKVTEKSIQEQLGEWRTLAKERGFLVAREFEESKSAKIPGVRPLYNEMIRLIEKGEINAILCWHVNRLARNMKEGGELAQLLIEGKIQEIRTPFQRFCPGDNILPFVCETATSTQYSLDLVKTVSRGMEGHFLDGGVNYKARQGYRNERDPMNCKRGVVVPDGERFTLIRKGWEMMLTGAYTPVQVIEILNNVWHYRTKRTQKRGGTPLSRSAAYQIFSDPFYAGYTWYKGQLRKGNHPPMVTEEEFHTVQQFLPRSERHQRRNKREYTFTGLMRCGYCGQQITAEHRIVAGKPYIFYHCSDSYNKCTKKGLSETAVEAEITKCLTHITISKALCQVALENIVRSLEAKSGDVRAIYAQQNRTLEDIEAQLDNLEQMWLTGLMSDPVRYKKREEELTTERNRLLLETERSRNELEHCRQNARSAASYICYARDHFMVGDMHQKREIAHALGIEYLFFGREKQMEVKLNPLLMEVVRFAKENFGSLELQESGSGTRKKSHNPALCSAGGTSETVFELSEALLSALRERLFPDLFVIQG